MAKPSAKAILDRWQRIRANPQCELSLDQRAVASFLQQPESEIVQSRILEALLDLARYRVKKQKFESDYPKGSGDLATCEGLDTFLVPAVENAVGFSEVLGSLAEADRAKFAEAVLEDIQDLVKNWHSGLFSSEPYGNTNELRRALRPTLKDELGDLNNTEAAAFACRVLVHLVTLLARDEEALFRECIGSKLDVTKLLDGLRQAISFLVESFQKGNGKGVSDKIVGSEIKGRPGSGWSWSAREGLPPMLFFTASVVDAFAELDLYLIRPFFDNPSGEGPVESEMRKFCDGNGELLDNLQLCIDMARRWIESSVLPYLSQGMGQYLEELPLEPTPFATESESYEGEFQPQSDRIEKKLGLKNGPPILYYNNIYALLSLLWTFSDWDSSGKSPNTDTKGKIDRALAQLIQRYTNPDIHEFLSRFPNVFYLPGEDIFEEGKKARCEYLDSAFLPLLTRLLVLFVVYGVGDRNLLEPVIRNLYVELLQNRDRTGDWPGLWAEKGVELYSTQRAVQALTFYYAYARGKELVDAPSNRGQALSNFVFRNSTGRQLVLEARFLEDDPDVEDDGGVPSDSHEELLREIGGGFVSFCRALPGYKDPPVSGLDPEKDKELLGFLEAVDGVATDVIQSVRKREVENLVQAREVLVACCHLMAEADSDEREAQLEELKKRYHELLRG